MCPINVPPSQSQASSLIFGFLLGARTGRRPHPIFLRNDTGDVTGLSMEYDRVKGIQFAKQ